MLMERSFTDKEVRTGYPRFSSLLGRVRADVRAQDNGSNFEKEKSARMRKIGYAFLAMAMLASFAAAQSSGTIAGKVTDEQGAPLPGVAVEGASSRLVGKAATVSDETGAFRLLSLPSGTYTITFTLQGFQPLKREGVILQLEQTITLNEIGRASCRERV